MENIIGWALVALLVVSTVAVLYAGFRYMKNRNEKKKLELEEKLARRERAREQFITRYNNSRREDQARESLRTHPEYNKPNFNPATASSAPTQERSGFEFADVATMMVLNHVLTNATGAASAKVDYDTGSISIKDEPNVFSSDDDTKKSSSWSSSWDSSSSNDIGSSSSWDSSGPSDNNW